MGFIPRATWASWRLFGIYLGVTAVPVIALGLLLAGGLRSEARNRGIDEGRAQAALLARTAILPALGGRSLDRRLTVAERLRLSGLARRAITDGQVLRLRLRDTRGRVVFSEDGAGFGGPPDHEALTAAAGTTIAKLTRLNADRTDTGRRGVAAVEVYLPLPSGTGASLGALEIYLPYASLANDLSAGLHTLYRDLAIGLTALYLVLFVTTLSLTGRLRREARRNAYLARYDTLTDLPNRALFQERVHEALRSTGPLGRQVFVATLDLDRFKEVNDALGHRNGDRVLIELARRLASRARPGETVARLGGDEFGLILRGSEHPEERLRRLRRHLEQEVEVAGLALSVEASVGYVIAPHDGDDADTLLQRSDAAMFAAKVGHAGVLHYHPDLERFDAERLNLVSELRHAIDDEQLVLHYQPLRDLETGRVTTVEALLRWEHPTRGLLYPDTFLVLAEQTDLIDDLTAWVLTRSLNDLYVLAPGGGLSMAVNVSARSLSSTTLAGEVITALQTAEVVPERLILEVTETAMMSDPLRAGALLGQLVKAGVRVSLDDFGQGQTSLSYLSALPLDELKVDRSFVTDMLENPTHAAIVRSMIELGHNLGLRVVAEGVDTETTLATLADAGCDVVQGFVIARPMALAELTVMLGPTEPPLPTPPGASAISESAVLTLAGAMATPLARAGTPG